METITLRELITAVHGQFFLGDPHCQVRNISTDTRTLHRGDCYFALTGKNFDGHDYIQEAFVKGTNCIVISRQEVDLGNPFPALPAVIKVADTLKALGDLAAYYRKKWDIPVIGITGSNGKTTTKEMLAGILALKGPTLKNEGNFNNQIGLPLTLFRLASTHQYAIVEMGTSVHGEIRRLAEIASPTIGIITNIGTAHLETFRDQNGVLEEKRALFDSLQPDGCAVINNDDPYLTGIAPSLKAEIVTYGIERDSMVRASAIEVWPDKPHFDLMIDNDSMRIDLPVYGKFNVYNALAAAAAAWRLGFDLKQIKQGLESFSPAGMRMEIRNMVSDVTIVNDAYNANPSSMREAISSFVQSFPDRDKVVVLGDMLELGERSVQEHRELGEFLASQPVSRIFLFGPQMTHAVAPLSNAQVQHFIDRDALENELKRALSPGTILFFKGSRGMHLEESINRIFSEGRVS